MYLTNHLQRIPFIRHNVCVVFIAVTMLSSMEVKAQVKDSETEAFYAQYSLPKGYTRKKKKDASFFQGNRKKENYFEGWYLKMVSNDGDAIMSVIPGISLSEDGSDQHAFIQIINGKTAETQYFQFPLDQFLYSKDKFAVKIGDNYFSKDTLILKIETNQDTITGAVYSSNHHELEIGGKQKHIMGWYRKVPFMQCYHGVVSLHHNLKGSIRLNDNTYDFNQGNGYIEKDWGSSMPSDWIWIQSNNFNTENTSFMLSIANIPWLGGSFTGFLGFFLHNGEVHRFATYTKANIDIANSNDKELKLQIKCKHITYILTASRSQSGLLKAPQNGSMDRRIAESVDASLKLIITDNVTKEVVYNGESHIAGLEIVGNLNNDSHR